MIVADVAAELAQALPALLDRGLYDASKWASDLLAACQMKSPRPPREDDDNDEFVTISMAKSLFGLRQYQQAANALKSCSSPIAIFIRSYSKFLSGEKRKQEQELELKEQLDRSLLSNPELIGLKDELSVLHRCCDLDAHCLFVYGVVLKHLDMAEEARQILLESVSQFPWNWSAWKTLSSLVTNVKILESLMLNEHWMSQFFLAEVYVELHASSEAFKLLHEIAERFPSNPYVRAQLALAHYNERDYDQAQTIFEHLRVTDPDRLDHMDTYSNILFVKENKGALSYLAHNAVKIDKYCPETCCIIGNYYSLKCDHEKAVLYFQRALRLSPSYLSAWTLMGHEYVELRNTVAINAYRRAVEIDARDYRAWYGLGQAYELLQMHTFALYYFGKATQVRPFDPRMWCAMADAYEKLDLIDDAIRCFRRAEANDDREGVAVAKLAKLYAAANETKKAVHYYKKLLAKFDDQHRSTSRDPELAPVCGASLSADAVEALLFLSEYYKSVGKLTEAEHCCSRLMESSANDEARALQKEIRQLRSSRTPRSTWIRSEDNDMSMSP